MPPLVYLARHGQTAYNHEGRFQGQQAIPLDEVGRAQAAELAERAAGYGFRALWCSPLLRARETADIVAARIGLEPKEDARLMETDAGDWTDLTFAEVRARTPELFDAFAAADADFGVPGGESFAEQEVRVDAALRDVEAGELPAVVVCHGMVIRAAFASRSAHGSLPFTRLPNAALVPLDPVAAAEAAARSQLGGGAATIAS
jgi:broad specificity phosphatase PhoE